MNKAKIKELLLKNDKNELKLSKLNVNSNSFNFQHNT